MKKRSTEQPPVGFVVLWTEQLRDGVEHGARVVPDRAHATALLDRLANGWAGDNLTFRLFELGVEVPLVEEAVEESEVKVVKRRKFITG